MSCVHHYHCRQQGALCPVYITTTVVSKGHRVLCTSLPLSSARGTVSCVHHYHCRQQGAPCPVYITTTVVSKGHRVLCTSLPLSSARDTVSCVRHYHCRQQGAQGAVSCARHYHCRQQGAQGAVSCARHYHCRQQGAQGAVSCARHYHCRQQGAVSCARHYHCHQQRFPGRKEKKHTRKRHTVCKCLTSIHQQSFSFFLSFSPPPPPLSLSLSLRKTRKTFVRDPDSDSVVAEFSFKRVCFSALCCTRDFTRPLLPPLPDDCWHSHSVNPVCLLLISHRRYFCRLCRVRLCLYLSLPLSTPPPPPHPSFHRLAVTIFRLVSCSFSRFYFQHFKVPLIFEVRVGNTV